MGFAPSPCWLASQGQPIAAYTHSQIDDAYGAAHISAQVVANAHIDLDRVLSRHDEVVGNSEDEAGRLGDVAWDALYDLISSVPTTALGLRGLVPYLADEVVDVAHQLQGEQLEMLLTTMSDTLLVLYPAA